MKIIVDLTGFYWGKSVGFNEYALSLFQGIAALCGSRDMFLVYVPVGQKKYFETHCCSIVIREVYVPNQAFRLIWHHLVFPVISLNGDIAFFPCNFAPLVSLSKYVLVVHDLNYLKNQNSFSLKEIMYRRIFSKRSILNASSVVAISKSTAHEIFNYFGVMASVVYNPVRMRHSDVDGSKNIILCPSSLVRYKNVGAAYDAVNNLLSGRTDCVAVFIGNWSIDSFPRKNDNKNIQLLGFVSDEVRVDLYSRACCVLVPSVYEGFGMPYIEAMMSGVSLVCSDIPVAREVVADYPYWIQSPFGAEQIYNALKQACDAGYKPKDVDAELKARYDPEVAATQYLSIFKSVIQQSS